MAIVNFSSTHFNPVMFERNRTSACISLLGAEVLCLVILLIMSEWTQNHKYDNDKLTKGAKYHTPVSFIETQSEVNRWYAADALEVKRNRLLWYQIFPLGHCSPAIEVPDH